MKASAEISDKIVKMAEKISSAKGLAASADIASKAPARLADVNSIADLEAPDLRKVRTGTGSDLG